MKIAVYHNLPGGGAKRALYEQVRVLVKRADVDLYYLNTNPESFLDLRPIVHASYVYPFFQLHRRRFWIMVMWVSFWIERIFFVRTAKRIATDIDSRGYDFVYIHQCEFTHIPPLTRYLKTPSIVYCQEPWRIMYEPKSKILDAIEHRDRLFWMIRTLEFIQKPWRRATKRYDETNARCATMILANSFYSREYIHKAYGRYAEVNYLGVDLQLFRDLGLERRGFALAVGALAGEKGYDFIIRSLGRVPEAVRPPLAIVADRTSGSSLEKYLRSVADELKVTVDFHANVTDDELVKLYNQAAVFVYAPNMEPFGLAAIEAMACGTPVVGIREGGLRETVHDGVNGFLTNRDEDEFAAAIARIVTDPPLRKKLSLQCRSSVERFSWEHSVDQLLELYGRRAGR